MLRWTRKTCVKCTTASVTHCDINTIVVTQEVALAPEKETLEVTEEPEKETQEVTLEPEKETQEVALEPEKETQEVCLLYTSPSPRDRQKSRMPSSA